MDKQDFFKAFENQMFEIAQKADKKLSVLIVAILKRFDTEGGVLTSSNSNKKLLSQILKLIRLHFTNLTDKIGLFLFEGLNDLVSINLDYFQREAKKTIIANKFKASLFERVGMTLKGAIKANGVIDTMLKDNTVGKTITVLISKAMKDGALIKDVVKKVVSFFVPTDGLSLTAKSIYHKGGFDFFQREDRRLSDEMAIDIGFNYAVYSGTVKDNSRDFCRARVNKIYSRREIMSWKDLQFKGRVNPYNPLTDQGSIRCRHHYSWISDETAQRLAATRGGINSYR